MASGSQERLPSSSRVPAVAHRFVGPLLLLASTVFSCGVAEVAVRYAPPYLGAMRQLMDEDPLTGYALRPGSRIPFAGMYSRLEAPVRAGGAYAALSPPWPNGKARSARTVDVCKKHLKQFVASRWLRLCWC